MAGVRGVKETQRVPCIVLRKQGPRNEARCLPPSAPLLPKDMVMEGGV